MKVNDKVRLTVEKSLHGKKLFKGNIGTIVEVKSDSVVVSFYPVTTGEDGFFHADDSILIELLKNELQAYENGVGLREYDWVRLVVDEKKYADMDLNKGIVGAIFEPVSENCDKVFVFFEGDYWEERNENATFVHVNTKDEWILKENIEVVHRPFDRAE